MNHRQLVLSANRKAKFAFLSLPEDLQDEVIEGLDGQTLTIEGARDLIRSRGHSIGHDAVSGYYRAVRRERRLLDAAQEFSRVFETFQDRPIEDAITAITHYVLARVASGDVGVKDVDVGALISGIAKLKALKAVTEPPQTGDRSNEIDQTGLNARRGIDEMTLKTVREQIYGIV